MTAVSEHTSKLRPEWQITQLEAGVLCTKQGFSSKETHFPGLAT